MRACEAGLSRAEGRQRLYLLDFVIPACNAIRTADADEIAGCATSMQQAMGILIALTIRPDRRTEVFEAVRKELERGVALADKAMKGEAP